MLHAYFTSVLHLQLRAKQSAAAKVAKARTEEVHALRARLAEVREVQSFQAVEAETHLEVSSRRCAVSLFPFLEFYFLVFV